MPPDVLGEEPSLQRADITVPEERICIPQQFLIGVYHSDPSSSASIIGRYWLS
jgi:hypothetical protein